MAPVRVEPSRVREFQDSESFAAWLARHHATEPELWIRIGKKGSGRVSITAAEAIETCLRWGWIDGIRKGLDSSSFLQRYTPRGPRSGSIRASVTS